MYESFKVYFSIHPFWVSVLISIKTRLSQRQYKMDHAKQQCIKVNIFTDEAPYIINWVLAVIDQQNYKQPTNDKL